LTRHPLLQCSQLLPVHRYAIADCIAAQLHGWLCNP
jgi:hypothetical protein